MSDIKKHTIFIVEDNQLYSIILYHHIKQKNRYNITCFSSGEECIKNLILKPDIIILDFFLKGMNGLVTLKEIRKLNTTIPVIILTSQTNEQTAKTLIAEGANAYVDKNDNPIIKVMAAIEKYENFMA